MKFKKIIIACALASFMTACTSEDVLVENNGSPISFRAGKDFSMTSKLTRGAILSRDGLPSFYVSAFNSIGQQLFENDQFVYDKNLGSFASTMKHYFPSDGSNVVFYAYYPSQDDLGCTVLNDELINFSPKQQFADQLDLITATATANKTVGAAGVQLNFSHQLTTVNFNAKNTNEAYVIKVCGVRLGQIVSKGDLDMGTSNWTLANEKNNYEIITEPYTLNNVSQNIFNQDYGILIPQSFQLNSWDPETDPKNTHKGAYIAFKINVETSGGAPVFPTTKNDYAWVATPIPSNIEWKAGEFYEYEIDFSESLGYISPEDGGDEGEELNFGEGEMGFTVSVTPWSAYNSPM